jgi:EmrB/QacA subfamily drug resistance transporter
VTHQPNKRGILLIVLVSYAIIVLDGSIVITGLPEIQRTLGFSEAGLSWVSNAYTITFGGLLLLGARMGDILGRRRIFATGLMLFSLASMLVGAAPTKGWLLLARGVQGAGAAIVAPSALALLQTTFPEGHERMKAVAYYAAVAGVASSLGLVFGGVLTDFVSWRMGFFVNLPIGLAVIAALFRFVAESERRGAEFGLIGAISSTAGMIALVYGIVRAATSGWSDSLTLGAMASGIVLLTVFVIDQMRADQPIMPLRLFASRQRVGAYAGRVLFMGGMVPFWFFMTQFLQIVKGYRPAEAGIAFLPTTITNFATAMLVPRLAKRFGAPQLAVGGLCLSVLGMLWLGQLTPNTPYLVGIATPLMLVGIGQGASLGPLTGAGVAGVKRSDAGAASGVVNVAQQLGGSLGLGALVVVAASYSAGTSVAARFTHGVASALNGAAVLVALGLLVVLALVAWPLRSHRHHSTPVESFAILDQARRQQRCS